MFSSLVQPVMVDNPGGLFTYKVERSVPGLSKNTNMLNRATEYDWGVFKYHPTSERLLFWQSVLALIMKEVPENIIPAEYTYSFGKLEEQVATGLLIREVFSPDEIRSLIPKETLRILPGMRRYYPQSITGDITPKALAMYVPSSVWYQHKDLIFCPSIHDHYMIVEV